MLKIFKFFKLIAALSLIILFAQSELGAAAKKSVSKKTPAKTSQQASTKIPVEMDYAGLVEKVMPSICAIAADNNVAGSGFFVSAQGDILTNYHVIKGAQKIAAKTNNGKVFFVLVKDFDVDQDIALLEPIKAMQTPFLKISAKLPRQGEAIMAVGNPQGLEGTVSNDIVSAFRLNNQLVQFTAPISPGSSGGALINARGEVVGMPTLIFKEGQNLNFALAPSVLHEFYNKAKNKIVNDISEIPTLDNALYEVGLDFYNKMNYKKAFSLFEATASRGHTASQFALGFMYETGQGIKQDYTQAAYWYRKAAEQGDIAAQNNLGTFYGKGQGIKQDYKQAAYWYRKAAEQGYASAQYNLGFMYANGQGVKIDYRQAVYWYFKAAEQEDPMAQNNLGVMYDNGRGVQQDYKQAVYWYRKAAEQGNALAQNNLGVMYDNGRGVQQDYKQAVYWYRKAAEQGDAWAQNNLGAMYANGNGIKRDFNQAIYWWQKSAAQGNTSARANLATLGIYDY